MNEDPTDYHGILFLVESANVPMLMDSIEMKEYLSANEILSAFDSITNENADPSKYRRYKYKFYQTVLTSEKYQTDLILFIDNQNGRNYSFLLRNYDSNRNILGELQFAKWWDNDHSHSSGIIDRDTLVKIKSYQSKKVQAYKIDSEGRFINVPFE